MAEVKDDGGPAFPVLEVTGGMSLRDWFAGQALNGHLASHTTGNLTPEKAAKAAYEYADSMLKARQK